MLVSKNSKILRYPNVNPKICVTLNTNPQRKSVECRWHWVPNAKFSRWSCTFHVVCAPFSPLATRKLANTNAFPVEYRLYGPNAKPSRPNAKPGGPNTSLWYIVCVGHFSRWHCVGHVDFMLFDSCSLMLGSIFL